MKSNRYEHITDADLLELYYKDNNQEWIGILLERYTLLLLGVCMKYLKNEQEAKDSVQQIFLKVLMEVSKYRIQFFKSWLYMVAKNHCLMCLRDKGKKFQELKENDTAGTEDSYREIVAQDSTLELLEAALQEIGPEQQRCVILFYLKKNSYYQIAEKTGFSLMQVKSFIQNGKRNLRIIMEKKLKEKSQRSNER